MRGKIARLDFQVPKVVGTLHEETGFRDRSREFADVLEVRVDALARPPAPDDLAVLQKPWILTVRDAAEGGRGSCPWRFAQSSTWSSCPGPLPLTSRSPISTA